MSDEFLGDRRAALEEAFFAKQNQAMLQKLRETDDTKQQRDALSAASGITDPAVLEKLAALGISADTLAALSLVPLVAVAWADGSLDERERRSAFSKAADAGLHSGTVSHQIFERWLAEKPSPALLGAWKDYAEALAASMDDRARRDFRQDILSRARAVAESAGGFLGTGKKVSAQEEKVLRDLEAAFPG
ncbi:MAG: hypothetical protein AB7S57_09785 [Acetobacteraceae bacterium]